MAVDVLRGNVGSRDGQTVLGGVREARRTIEAGSRIGEHKQVLDAPGAESADARAARRAALLAELAALAG